MPTWILVVLVTFWWCCAMFAAFVAWPAEAPPMEVDVTCKEVVEIRKVA